MSFKIFSKALHDAIGLDKIPAKDENNLMKVVTEEDSVMLPSEDAIKSVRDASCLAKAPKKKKIDYFKIKEDEDKFSLTEEETEELLKLASISASDFWIPEDMVLQDIYTPRISDNMILCNSLANDNCYANYVSESHSSKSIDAFSTYCCEKQMQYEALCNKIYGLGECGYLQVPSPDIASFIPYGQNSNHKTFRQYSSSSSSIEDDLLSEDSSLADIKRSISIISKPSTLIDNLSSECSPLAGTKRSIISKSSSTEDNLSSSPSSTGMKRSISIISKSSSKEDNLSTSPSSTCMKRSISIISKSSSTEDNLSSSPSSTGMKRSISIISKEYLNRNIINFCLPTASICCFSSFWSSYRNLNALILQ